MSENNDVEITFVEAKSINAVGSSGVSTDKIDSGPLVHAYGPPTWTVRLQTNRKGSTDTAARYVEACGGELHLYSPASRDPVPHMLNLYFAVDVDIDNMNFQASTRLYIAQGHQELDGHNNWWAGGADMRRLDLEDGHLILQGKNSRGSRSERRYRLSGTYDKLVFNLV